MTTTLTILVLLIGIALFVGGGLMFTFGGKKLSITNHIIQKVAAAVAVVMIAGSTTQLYVTKVNPGILKDMIEAMQKQEQAEQVKKEERRNAEIAKKIAEDVDSLIGHAPIVGDEKAEKTIFLWSDYSCPYCRRVHAAISEVMKDRKDVRLVLKNFSIHGALSDAPAQAVIAAKIQSNAKAAKLDKLLMEKEYFSRDDMSPATIQANVMKLAKEAGLDTKKLAADMKGDIVREELANVRKYANEFGINGTPFLIVNGKVFAGAVPAHVISGALDE